MLSSLIEVDLIVEFENSIGFNVNNIDIIVELFDFIDLIIIDCLFLVLISVVLGFLVFVLIFLKVDVGFGFEGLVMVEFYIKVIYYMLIILWCLFMFYDGGEFEDIIMLMLLGSFCVCGSIG